MCARARGRASLVPEGYWEEGPRAGTGLPTCLFMVPMALVTPFMACAMELLDLSV